MASCKAIIENDDGRTARIADVTVPDPQPGWLLVKVKAVAINPTDWRHVAEGWTPPGSRVGCDYSGIVEKVGAGDVAGFSVGDPIAGFTHGCHFTRHELGSFGEYLLAKAAVQMKIPPSLSFEQAATLGVSIVTIGQGLYKTLGLPLPISAPATPPLPLLIHGASTATGLYAVQFAKLSGFTVYATASPRNFDSLRLLGADHLFDYRSPDCGPAIRAHTNGKLLHAWDCAGGDGDVICAQALSADEVGKYASITVPNDEVVRKANPLVDGPHKTLGYDCFSEPYIAWGKLQLNPGPEEMEFSRMFWGVARDLFASGAVKPIRIEVNRGGAGLEGVLHALRGLKDGSVTVSGGKLVYTVGA